MGVFQTVSNWLLGQYNVRCTNITSDNAQIQHFRMDIGTGQSEQTVDSTHGVPYSAVPATAAATTTVAASATSVTLLAANTSRKSASIFNDSTVVLWVKYGATASTTSFKVQLVQNAYFEFPQPCYTGRVDGIWAVATGNARISEET